MECPQEAQVVSCRAAKTVAIAIGSALRMVGVIQVEISRQVLDRRIPDVPAAALALRGTQETTPQRRETVKLGHMIAVGNASESKRD